jgi:N-acetylneuraminic acid mutarotase
MKPLVIILTALALGIIPLQCGIDYATSGGSGTETVGMVGKVVDPQGQPVSAAEVRVKRVSLVLDSVLDSLYIVSDNAGNFRINETATGLYRIEARKDTGLVIIVEEHYAPPRYFTNEYWPIGTFIMQPPGSISGYVLMKGKTDHLGIEIFIPGTSHAARSSYNGFFRITSVPPDTYDLVYRTDDFVQSGVSKVVVVAAADTRVDSVTLVYDPGRPPPTPQNPRANYDTLSGTVTFGWDSVAVSDLDGYQVSVDRGNGFNFLGNRTYPTVLKDTVFRILLDTTTLTCIYKVRSVDKNGDYSLYSTPVTIKAVSPALTATTIVFDSIAGDSMRITASVSNPTRFLAAITWRADDQTTIRPIVGSVRKAIDTLAVKFDDTLDHKVILVVTDVVGHTWRDSIIVRGTQIAPIDKWENYPQVLPQRCQGHTAVAAGDKIYVAGGKYSGLMSTSAQKKLYILDCVTNIWQTKNIASERVFGTLVYTNNKLLHIGGQKTNDIPLDNLDIIDPQAGAIDTTLSMPWNLSQHAACAINGLVYCIGGLKNGEASTDIDVFDPRTHQWSQKAARLNTPRKAHQAVECNNLIYIIGGFDADDNVLKTVEIYNPATDMVTLAPSINSARGSFGAAVVRGQIYVFGGFVATLTQSMALSSTEVFNPAKSNAGWTTRNLISNGTSTQCRHSFATVGVNDKIYLIGGNESSDDWFKGQTASILRYIP